MREKATLTIALFITLTLVLGIDGRNLEWRELIRELEDDLDIDRYDRVSFKFNLMHKHCKGLRPPSVRIIPKPLQTVNLYNMPEIIMPANLYTTI